MEGKARGALNTLDIVIVGYSVWRHFLLTQLLTALKGKKIFASFGNRNYEKFLIGERKAFLEEFDNSYFVEIDSFEYLTQKCTKV